MRDSIPELPEVEFWRRKLARYNFGIMADNSDVLNSRMTYESLCECQDMLMDMACQEIPCDPLQAMLTYLTNELPSLSFDERVERLHTFIAMLEKNKAKYRNAANAAAQLRQQPRRQQLLRLLGHLSAVKLARNLWSHPASQAYPAAMPSHLASPRYISACC